MKLNKITGDCKKYINKKSVKSENGITIIALVTTIIILLILAGVSLNSIFSENGIIKKAQEAQNKMDEMNQNDIEELSKLENLLDSYMNATGSNEGNSESGNNSTENGETERPTVSIITDSSLSSNDRTSSSETVITKDTNGNQVVIPGGFKISADSGTSVQQGIVIEDADGNQFVWVPVSNVDGSNSNPIILDDGTETVITLGRYEFDTTDGKETLIQKGSEYAQTTYANVMDDTVDPKYRVVSPEGSSYGYFYEFSNKGRIGVANADYGENSTAKDLEKFVAKTKNNKGYYIARYEASYGSGNNIENFKPLSKPSTSYGTSTSMTTTVGKLWNATRQFLATKICQNMYNEDEYVESDLVNSYAWDTAIVYIQAMGNSNYANKVTSSSLMNTGTTGDEVCKIYDMAGNETEWTTEHSTVGALGSNIDPCTTRGGSYGLYKKGAAYRDAVSSAASLVANSFRTILYVL